MSHSRAAEAGSVVNKQTNTNLTLLHPPYKNSAQAKQSHRLLLSRLYFI